MNIKCCSMLLPVLLSVLSLPAYAASLECNGNIISAGITEQDLLDACGEPTSRDGANWIYHRPGGLPVMVTFGNGMAMFIRDVDSEDYTAPSAPFGDHP